MRLRISLFELLLLVIPACAVVLGLLVASVNSGLLYVLTIAQCVYLAAMLGAICALFQRQSNVRAFGGAFLAASLGHLLLVHLASQSSYAGGFPTTFALTKIWEQANPGQAVGVDYSVSYMQSGGGTWFGGSGYSGGMYPGGVPFGSSIPVFTNIVPAPRPLFVDVGVWAISLLLGVLCGVAAKALRGPEPANSTATAS